MGAERDLLEDADADLVAAGGAHHLLEVLVLERHRVEVVRWGDGGPHQPETRLQLVDVTTDAGVGEVTVRLARGEEESLGRASTAGGLPAAVEATVVAVRWFVPELPYLPGWARTVETTPDRRFLVVASVTDPITRTHRRGAAEGATPIEGAVRATLAALNRTISREL